MTFQEWLMQLLQSQPTPMPTPAPTYDQQVGWDSRTGMPMPQPSPWAGMSKADKAKRMETGFMNYKASRGK